MLMANLAIAGIPPFSGFFSKDAILATAYERGYAWIYYILLFTAFLTAFMTICDPNHCGFSNPPDHRLVLGQPALEPVHRN